MNTYKFIKYVNAMAHFCKVFLIFPKSEEKREKSGLLSYRKAVFLINFFGKFYNYLKNISSREKQTNGHHFQYYNTTLRVNNY